MLHSFWKRLPNLISHMDNLQINQVRNKFINCWMIRDHKRRKMVQEAAVDRLRINSLRKNDILPVELRECADKELAAFPLNTWHIRVHGRCVVTSRPRGLVKDYRMSRIVWRRLADYNHLANVQRAMW